MDQAIKHLQDFLEHLDRDAMQSSITPQVKEALDSDVKALIEMWTQSTVQS